MGVPEAIRGNDRFLGVDRRISAWTSDKTRGTQPRFGLGDEGAFG